jgi:hypothetical protein
MKHAGGGEAEASIIDIRAYMALPSTKTEAWAEFWAKDDDRVEGKRRRKSCCVDPLDEALGLALWLALGLLTAT